MDKQSIRHTVAFTLKHEPDSPASQKFLRRRRVGFVFEGEGHGVANALLIHWQNNKHSPDFSDRKNKGGDFGMGITVVRRFAVAKPMATELGDKKKRGPVVERDPDPA